MRSVLFRGAVHGQKLQTRLQLVDFEVHTCSAIHMPCQSISPLLRAGNNLLLVLLSTSKHIACLHMNSVNARLASFESTAWWLGVKGLCCCCSRLSSNLWQACRSGYSDLTRPSHDYESAPQAGQLVFRIHPFGNGGRRHKLQADLAMKLDLTAGGVSVTQHYYAGVGIRFSSRHSAPEPIPPAPAAVAARAARAARTRRTARGALAAWQGVPSYARQLQGAPAPQLPCLTAAS